MDIRTALKQGLAQLREAHVPSYTLAAELLLLHILARDRTWIYAHPEEEISPSDAERYSAFLRRRTNGVPTQHLTGKQEFWGLEFEVTPDVLIPRPETEHVIEVALERLAVREIRAGRPPKNDGAGLRIVDVGTGSGCIAIALAKELPAAEIYATDISSAALAVARRNATRHGVHERIHFLESDLLANVSAIEAQRLASLLGKAPRATTNVGAPPTVGGAVVGARYIVPLQTNAATDHKSRITSHESRSFDLIVSNPPYVARRNAATLMREVREHEPEIALYGGEEGYELYSVLIAQAAEHLKAGGILVLELGHDSLPAVKPLLDAPIWTNVGVTNDLSGIPRVIAAERA